MIGLSIRNSDVNVAALTAVFVSVKTRRLRLVLVLVYTDVSAGQLIHPRRSPDEVETASAEGHDLYRLTSGDFWPGEQSSRYYAHPSYDPCRRFGVMYNIRDNQDDPNIVTKLT